MHLPTHVELLLEATRTDFPDETRARVERLAQRAREGDDYQSAAELVASLSELHRRGDLVRLSRKNPDAVRRLCRLAEHEKRLQSFGDVTRLLANELVLDFDAAAGSVFDDERVRARQREDRAKVSSVTFNLLAILAGTLIFVALHMLLQRSQCQWKSDTNTVSFASS